MKNNHLLKQSIICLLLILISPCKSHGADTWHNVAKQFAINTAVNTSAKFGIHLACSFFGNALAYPLAKHDENRIFKLTLFSSGLLYQVINHHASPYIPRMQMYPPNETNCLPTLENYASQYLAMQAISSLQTHIQNLMYNWDTSSDNNKAYHRIYNNRSYIDYGIDCGYHIYCAIYPDEIFTRIGRFATVPNFIYHSYKVTDNILYNVVPNVQISPRLLPNYQVSFPFETEKTPNRYLKLWCIRLDM